MKQLFGGIPLSINSRLLFYDFKTLISVHSFRFSTEHPNHMEDEKTQFVAP